MNLTEAFGDLREWLTIQCCALKVLPGRLGGAQRSVDSVWPEGGDPWLQAPGTLCVTDIDVASAQRGTFLFPGASILAHSHFASTPAHTSFST